MKKSILLLALAVLGLGGHISASSVSQQTAQTIALNYYKVTVPAAANNLSASLNYTRTEADGTVDFYVFDIAPSKGFVIVSADDNCIPVIAYSSEASFDANERGMTGLTDWMKSSAAKINYVITNHIQADANIRHLWSSYAQGINPQVNRVGNVGPLCTTIWNQSPYYNSLCPPASQPSTSTTKSVTGCVATAMAQIMKYWNYPYQGTGSHSYNDGPPYYSQNYGTLSADFTRVLNWAAMPNNVTTNNNAADSLSYELGVAVNMDYSPTGSGAFVLISETWGGGPSSESVYATNFYYNPNTLQGVHLSNYSTAAWITLMETEINAGRVVQYEGADPSAGGHTWVMDGYSPNSAGDLLHMNWGWGGANNGWFSVTNLATPGFNPSNNDAALIGIQPLTPFNISLSASSPSVCPSTSSTLTAHGPASATYTWTPATGLTCSTCAVTDAAPTATTLYKVVIDSAGYTATASVVITVTQGVTAGFNYASLPSCNLPENVSFTNTSLNAASYVWDFGDGSATSSATSPVHTYTANGDYTVKLFATNGCGTDSMIVTQVAISGGAPTAASQNICNGDVATLTASGSNINWFSDNQGSIMQSGNTYVSPPLSSTITYYVGSIVSPAVVPVGAANDAIGTSNVYSTSGVVGMKFNCTTAQTLNSVVVYASGAGDRLFLLEDASGNVLDSATITLTPGMQTVPLGFAVPVGNNLLLAISGVANLYRNTTGAVYPYNSADGTISITGNSANAATRWYFFYNWQFQQPSCTSPLTPVTVYVLGTGGNSFTASGTGTPTVNFTPADQTATSYAWDFGDGNTSTDMNPTHVYAAGGTYTVSLVISNGNCSETVTQTVKTNVLGINDLHTFSAFSVFPNPAKDVLTLSVNSSKQFNDCQLMISNVLGQNAYSKPVDLSSGDNKLNINISDLTAGIYFISLKNGKDVVTAKFVKGNE